MKMRWNRHSGPQRPQKPKKNTLSLEKSPEDLKVAIQVRSLQWYCDNGCELREPDGKMLYALYETAHGYPCVGCNCTATCPAWRMLKEDHKAQQVRERGNVPKPKTNAEIAEELGVSKRQVAKMRRRGEIR